MPALLPTPAGGCPAVQLIPEPLSTGSSLTQPGLHSAGFLLTFFTMVLVQNRTPVLGPRAALGLTLGSLMGKQLVFPLDRKLPSSDSNRSADAGRANTICLNE